MSPELLHAATDCGLLRASRWAPHISAAMSRWGIDSAKRQACFLAQIAHESGNFSRLEESLNYKVDALIGKFGRHRISLDDARRFGRNESTGQKADQKALANILYGGPWGARELGNTEPGDGSRFIGRGLKQLTGRANAKAYQSASGHPVVAYPELLLQPEIAADSAGWFWAAKGCNALADAMNVVALTKLINGGDNGLLERQALTQRAFKSLSRSG